MTTARIRKAKALNPGPSRKERRQKQLSKAEQKQGISLAFAEAAAKLAGRAPERDTEPPDKPRKPRATRPAWMDRQEQQALGWAWDINQ